MNKRLTVRSHGIRLALIGFVLLCHHAFAADSSSSINGVSLKVDVKSADDHDETKLVLDIVFANQTTNSTEIAVYDPFVLHLRIYNPEGRRIVAPKAVVFEPAADVIKLKPGEKRRRSIPIDLRPYGILVGTYNFKLAYDTRLILNVDDESLVAKQFAANPWVNWTITGVNHDIRPEKSGLCRRIISDEANSLKEVEKGYIEAGSIDMAKEMGITIDHLNAMLSNKDERLLLNAAIDICNDRLKSLTVKKNDKSLQLIQKTSRIIEYIKK